MLGSSVTAERVAPRARPPEPTRVEREADLAACARILAAGSKSFAAAGRLLPARVRGPAAAVYAFCRVADDAIDAERAGPAALARLLDRLDRAYAARPLASPVDRAFSRVVLEHGIPRALPEALLDGMAWDLEGRRYADLAALRAYAARVAASVGAMMTVLMGERRPEALARACDLGVAMQLTNIARDVGADARLGRVYLPLDRLAAHGVDADRLVARPAFSPALGCVVEEVLAHADELYRRADPGVAMLPRDCRVAIRAARLIYGDIGRVVRRHGHDSVSRRAVVSTASKLRLLLASLPALLARPPRAHDPALEETRFLVEAACS